MKLAGNTVLITGGSSGIGFAIAEAFLAAGSMVIVCARGEDRLTEAKHKHPTLQTRVCDVSDSTDRKNLVAYLNDHFPTLNVLVNNAGVQRDIDFTNGIDEFLAGDNEVRINLEGPIILTGMLLPLLEKNANPVVINVSSGLAFHPMAEMPVYCATKAGMHMFTTVLREQLAPAGVKVVEIVPPALDTNLNPAGRAKRAGFKAGIGPDEFVASVMHDLEKDAMTIGYGMTAEAARH